MCTLSTLVMAVTAPSCVPSVPAQSPLPVQQIPRATSARIEDEEGRLIATGTLVRYSTNQAYFILEHLDKIFGDKAVTIYTPDEVSPLNFRIDSVYDSLPDRTFMPMYIQVHYNPDERLVLEHLIDNLAETTLGRANLELKKNVTIDVFDSDGDTFLRDNAGFIVADRLQFHQITVDAQQVFRLLTPETDVTVEEVIDENVYQDLLDYDGKLSKHNRTEFLEFLFLKSKVHIARWKPSARKNIVSENGDDNISTGKSAKRKNIGEVAGYLTISRVDQRVFCLYADTQAVAEALIAKHIKEYRTKTIENLKSEKTVMEDGKTDMEPLLQQISPNKMQFDHFMKEISDRIADVILSNRIMNVATINKLEASSTGRFFDIVCQIIGILHSVDDQNASKYNKVYLRVVDGTVPNFSACGKSAITLPDAKFDDTCRLDHDYNNFLRSASVDILCYDEFIHQAQNCDPGDIVYIRNFRAHELDTVISLKMNGNGRPFNRTIKIIKKSHFVPITYPAISLDPDDVEEEEDIKFPVPESVMGSPVREINVSETPDSTVYPSQFQCEQDMAEATEDVDVKPDMEPSSHHMSPNKLQFGLLMEEISDRIANAILVHRITNATSLCRLEPSFTGRFFDAVCQVVGILHSVDDQNASKYNKVYLRVVDGTVLNFSMCGKSAITLPDAKFDDTCRLDHDYNSFLRSVSVDILCYDEFIQEAQNCDPGDIVYIRNFRVHELDTVISLKMNGNGRPFNRTIKIIEKRQFVPMPILSDGGGGEPVALESGQSTAEEIELLDAQENEELETSFDAADYATQMAISEMT